nr:glucose-6-phosphate dehydrogenase assembly protein OpcA [Chloroflexia bacterium]
ARPAARPIPGASWEAHVLDAGAITTELNRLWAQVVDPRAADGTAAGDAPVGVLTRASTLNLTAVARSRQDAERVESAVVRLGDLYPSRATILVADPDHPRGPEPGIDVRVALLEQEAGLGRPAIRFECVTVEVNADDERQLASIASPLLVADLPDFLWWAADSVVGSDLFDDLIEVSDRLIIDTAAAANPAAELDRLAALLDEGGHPPKLSDFAWARLDPWRHLVALFFDRPQVRPTLDAIDEVQIVFGTAGADGRTGLTGALLFAGWLGSRLGWQAPGELVRSRNEPTGWRATLRSGGRDRRREVLLSLRPAPDPVADCGLATVTLLAEGGASFRVERFDPAELATFSQVDALPTGRRMVYAPVADDAALLADELRDFGHDAIYETALRFATPLAPG